jgi:seryl-tRNA synthetase
LNDELCWYVAGQSGYSGALLRLNRRLDELFLRWASDWNASEWVFPIFAPASELQRVDYLGSFPHLAMFPLALDKSERNLEDFVNAQKGCLDHVELTATEPVKQLLTPAACYHVYIRFQGRSYDAPVFVTTRNTCFRNEHEFVPLKRQSGFSMREIVCIGSESEVTEFLSLQQERIARTVRDFGLNVEFATANDPFFQPARNPKALVQRLAPSKTELVFNRQLAVGSINFHRNYFGEAFDMTRAGRPLCSGCVAFGVERWMAMVLEQLGYDARNWPQEFRD